MNPIRWWRRATRLQARRALRRATERRPALQFPPEMLENRCLLSALFGPTTYLPAPYVVHDVTIGDLNNDGLDDLIEANASPYQSIRLWLSQPGGGFSAAKDIPVGTGQMSVHLANLNADNRPDLVVTGGATVILLGNGDGTFGAPVAYGPTGTQSAAVADFDKDGDLDVLSALYNASSLIYLSGNGDGTFGVAAVPLPGIARWIAAGDFNKDGNADVAAVNYPGNNVYILLGSGNGTFQPSRTFSVGSGAHAVTTGDVNADGNLDIVTANRNANSVSILRGNGTGDFTVLSPVGVGSLPQDVEVVDVNRDGKLDLATAHAGSGSVSLMLGNGDGTFTSAGDLTPGGGTNAVASGDVNGDGMPDLAASTHSGNSIAFWENIAAPPVPVAQAGGPYTILEGQSLALDASTTTGFSSAASYSWDVNDDGVFGDAVGVNPTVAWNGLIALGIDDGPESASMSRSRIGVQVVHRTSAMSSGRRWTGYH